MHRTVLAPPRTPGLHCHVRPERGRIVLSPVGELDVATVATLEAELREVRAVGFDAVAIDLRQVTFIASAGVALLIRWAAEARRDGWRLEVLPARERVERVLEITGARSVM